MFKFKPSKKWYAKIDKLEASMEEDRLYSTCRDCFEDAKEDGLTEEVWQDDWEDKPCKMHIQQAKDDERELGREFDEDDRDDYDEWLTGVGY